MTLTWFILVTHDTHTHSTMRGVSRSPSNITKFCTCHQKNDSHDWSSSHIKCLVQCAEHQGSPSNITKFCACHKKWLSWSIDPRTHEMPSTMCGATRATLQHHQILRLPRQTTLMIDPRHTWGVTLQLHQILPLPPKMTLKIDPDQHEMPSTMRAASRVTLQDQSNITQFLRLPRKMTLMFDPRHTYETPSTRGGATGVYYSLLYFIGLYWNLLVSTLPNYSLLYFPLLFSTLLDSTFLYYSQLFSAILYSALLFSTLLYSSLLHSSTFSPLLEYSLLYSTRLYYSLLFSTILYSSLLFSTILYSTRLYFPLLFSTVLCYSLLCYTLLYSALLFSSPLNSTFLYYSLPFSLIFKTPQLESFSPKLPLIRVVNEYQHLVEGHTWPEWLTHLKSRQKAMESYQRPGKWADVCCSFHQTTFRFIPPCNPRPSERSALSGLGFYHLFLCCIESCSCLHRKMPTVCPNCNCSRTQGRWSGLSSLLS